MAARAVVKKGRKGGIRCPRGMLRLPAGASHALPMFLRTLGRLDCYSMGADNQNRPFRNPESTRVNVSKGYREIDIPSPSDVVYSGEDEEV